jgi:hypothetical protein
MVMRGANLREVQKVLGHRIFAMTLRCSHLSPSQPRAAVDRLDGLMPTPVPAALQAEPMAQGMAQHSKIGSVEFQVG